MSQNHSDYSEIFSTILREKLSDYSNQGIHRVYTSNNDYFFAQIVGLDRKYKQGRLEQKQNLDRHYDTIFSGCSETYGDFIAGKPFIDGQHVDLDPAKPYIWGTIVSEVFGYNYANLAMGGASAISILDDYLYQVKNYGAPKNFFVLYPRIDSRMPFFEDPGYLINLEEPNSTAERDEVFNAVNIGAFEADHKISKRPHLIQEVMSQPYVTYLNLQAILQAEILCKITKTNFMYSSWSLETTSIIEASNEAAEILGSPAPFENYIKIDYHMVGTDYERGAESISWGCHQELQDHRNFYMGEGGSHMGVHSHRHVADNFIEKLTKRGYAATL